MAYGQDITGWIQRLINFKRQNDARGIGAPQGAPAPPLMPPGGGVELELDPQGNAAPMTPAPAPSGMSAGPPQESRLDRTLGQAEKLNNYAQMFQMANDAVRGPQLATPSLPRPQVGPALQPTATRFAPAQPQTGNMDIEQLIALLSRR